MIKSASPSGRSVRPLDGCQIFKRRGAFNDLLERGVGHFVNQAAMLFATGYADGWSGSRGSHIGRSRIRRLKSHPLSVQREACQWRLTLPLRVFFGFGLGSNFGQRLLLDIDTNQLGPLVLRQRTASARNLSQRDNAIAPPRRDLDCRGAGACADQRVEIRAATVLRLVGVVDKVVNRPVDRLEADFLRHAGGSDPPRLLPHRSLVPTRVPPVVGAHVEVFADRDGPDPRRGPYVTPSSRNGETCRSSASAILRSSSFDHVVIL